MSYDVMQKALAKVNVNIPAGDDKIVIDENANLNFIAWGDPQISSISPLRSSHLKSACLDVANAEGKFDLITMLGDITEYGRECEYQFTASLLDTCKGKFDNLICVSGNHDVRLRNHKKQIEKFNAFLKSVNGGIVGPDDRYWFATTIKGYKFIMLGTDAATFEGSYLSTAQLKWLDKELAKSKDDKAVFVLNHQTLKNTNGLPYTWLGKGKWRGSVGWQSDKLADVFSKYNNVIYITGHLHFGTNWYNFEDCGGFKSLCVPTVGVNNHGTPDNDGQGYVISVYDDKIVMRARIFAEGKWFPKDHPGAYIEIKI